MLGRWTPSLRISVVIPHYRAATKLERTLAGLAEQSYPADLTEVVVVDDGSDPPLRLAPTMGLDVHLIHQTRQGFGVARARNLGAREATGDLLVFLDCDMLPERHHLEAHARWHHLCDHAVTLGARRHVDADDMTAGAISEAVRDDRLGALFADRPQLVPAFIQSHLDRTDELRSAHDDLFRVVAGGNLGVGRELFDSVGGFDATFAQWGGEDTELGFRLFNGGGLLIPEPAAACWHQGQGHEPDEGELRSLDEQRARLSQLIAHRGFRRTSPGRAFTVPRVRVDVDAGDQPRSRVLATVESVLASELHDLVVLLRLSRHHPQGEWLRRQFAGDPRVVLNEAEVVGAIPLNLELPAGAVVDTTTLGVLLERLTDVEEPLGVLWLTVPHRAPAEARSRAWTTRAAARGARAVGACGHARRSQPGDLDAALDAAGQLFGQAWVSGTDVGIRWADDEPRADAVPDAAPLRAGGDVQAEAMELWQVVSALPADQRARIVHTARAGLSHLGPRQLRLLLTIAQRMLWLLGALKRLGR